MVVRERENLCGAIVMNNILHNSTLEPSLATIYTKGNIELSPMIYFLTVFFKVIYYLLENLSVHYCQF